MDTSYRVEKVGLIGAGLMGTGVAEAATRAGFPTVLVKATPGDPAAARAVVEKSLRRQAERGKLAPEAVESALARLTVTGDRGALCDCDLVIESIVEDLDEKRRLFADLAGRLRDDCVVASNTSTLRIRDLVVPGLERRAVGLHFFSPVHAMALVELAYLDDTPKEIMAGIEAFVAALGKTAVPVRDSTGFIVNRLLVPYLIGAIAAYGEGLATAPQIDTAMKLGCGHPIGPLALSDLIGLDVVFAMSKLLYRDFSDPRYRPPALLRRMVQDGRLGKKVGLGFYDYSQRPPAPNQEIWKLIQSGTSPNEHAA